MRIRRRVRILVGRRGELVDQPILVRALRERWIAGEIGIPDPSFTAPFVGVFEIVFGTLSMVGFLTRLSAISLLIDIAVAIAATKIPMLLDKGFRAAAHEARTDLCMLLGLLFLLLVGAGPLSIDLYLSGALTRNERCVNSI